MRYLIYQRFARTGGPPSVPALAAELGIADADALALLHELEARHSVLLIDNRHDVCMVAGLQSAFAAQVPVEEIAWIFSSVS